MSQDLEIALELAPHIHRTQEYAPGLPYFEGHLARVANLAYELGYSDSIIAICLLHDSVEDTDLTLSDLQEIGISKFVVDGITAMTYTQEDEMNGVDKIAKARSHVGAHVGKLLDATVNLSQAFSEVDEVASEISVRRILRYREYIARTIIDLPKPHEVDAVEKDYASLA